MVKQKQSWKIGIGGLIVLLLLVVSGGVLFVGAVSGWFEDSTIVIDEEFDCEEECDKFIDIEAEGYEDLIKAEKSFVILVDQNGCTTADRLRGFTRNWAKENGKKVHRIMFEEMKETSLHESVKYYPSVVLVGEGKVKGFLRADADADAEMYNDEEVLKGWVNARIRER